LTDKKWLIGSLVILAVFSYFMTSFAQETIKITRITDQLRGGGSGQPADREQHIVLIEQEQGHPYWELVEQGAIKAAAEVHIAIECIGPVRNNMEEQLKLLEKAIASRVDGIIVQGLNQAKFNPVINKAVERGIPVVTVDTDAPDSKRMAFVGTDNLEAGRKLGRLVVKATGGSGKIGVIIGSENAENQLQRLEGIKRVIGEYPELAIVDVRSSNISMLEAIQQAAEMLQSHPEITIMVGTSATDALGILQSARSLKRQDMKIIGFDDLPDTIHAIRNGEILATVVQQPYEMGELSVQLLESHFSGKPIQSTRFTHADVMDRSSLRAADGGKTP
jgi:ribose transport system substrate-binding protein